jgi:hypothetical protein
VSFQRIAFLAAVGHARNPMMEALEEALNNRAAWPGFLGNRLLQKGGLPWEFCCG